MNLDTQTQMSSIHSTRPRASELVQMVQFNLGCAK